MQKFVVHPELREIAPVKPIPCTVSLNILLAYDKLLLNWSSFSPNTDAINWYLWPGCGQILRWWRLPNPNWENAAVCCACGRLRRWWGTWYAMRDKCTSTGYANDTRKGLDSNDANAHGSTKFLFCTATYGKQQFVTSSTTTGWSHGHRWLGEKTNGPISTTVEPPPQQYQYWPHFHYWVHDADRMNREHWRSNF